MFGQEPFPLPRGLVGTGIAFTPDMIVVAAKSIDSSAECPDCGKHSGRIHSRYVRTAADLPWQGRRVILRLTARRFRCRTVGCRRVIFCERLPNVLAPLARSTGRFMDVQRAVGLAVGGEAGARLCHQLALPTSGDTLLRRVKAISTNAYLTPRVLGVDDFAFRKGHTYGTILLDQEQRRVVDLLPDRTADTFADWLRRHPGVEIITRDRASAYSQAAATAAPNATQVADRFHLLINLREVVERMLEARTAILRTALVDAVPLEITSTHSTADALASRDDKGLLNARQSVFQQVRELHASGVSLRRIARDFNLHYRTVERYVRSDSCPDWNRGRPRPSVLDEHVDYVRQRLREGCRSAAQIGRELTTRGYSGAASVVRNYVRRLRAEMGLAAARPSRPLPIPRPLPPSARRMSMAVVRRPTERTDAEKRLVERVKEGDPDFRSAVELAERFAALIRDRDEAGLEEWLTRAAQTPVLRSFAQGLRRDEAAVRAGLSHAWSNGPVEGAVNRLKYLKRQMLGRAGFDLLKARVLNAA